MIAQRATDGLVAGGDPSPTIAQAAARNRPSLRSRRAELKVGSASEIPYPNASFDKFAASTTSTSGHRARTTCRKSGV